MWKCSVLLLAILLVGCGKPSGITDEDYNKYKEFGSPKLLYSCTYNKSFSASSEDTNKCNGIADQRDRDQCWGEVRSKTKPVSVTDVGYSAGIGISATYNKLLDDAKDKCTGLFKIIEREEK